MTTVVNLSTGEERIYHLPPTDSVIAAWQQAQGNYNTWTYDARRPRCYYGEHTVACGDWCAARD